MLRSLVSNLNFYCSLTCFCCSLLFGFGWIFCRQVLNSRTEVAFLVTSSRWLQPYFKVITLTSSRLLVPSGLAGNKFCCSFRLASSHAGASAPCCSTLQPDCPPHKPCALAGTSVEAANRSSSKSAGALCHKLTKVLKQTQICSVCCLSRSWLTLNTNESKTALLQCCSCLQEEL